MLFKYIALISVMDLHQSFITTWIHKNVNWREREFDPQILFFFLEKALFFS